MFMHYSILSLVNLLRRKYEYSLIIHSVKPHMLVKIKFTEER